jgi:hypothetical protein
MAEGTYAASSPRAVIHYPNAIVPMQGWHAIITVIASLGRNDRRGQLRLRTRGFCLSRFLWKRG